MESSRLDRRSSPELRVAGKLVEERLKTVCFAELRNRLIGPPSESPELRVESGVLVAREFVRVLARFERGLLRGQRGVLPELLGRYYRSCIRISINILVQLSLPKTKRHPGSGYRDAVSDD